MQVPWHFFSTLLNRTEALWQSSPQAAVRVQCEGPPCADCAHVLDQHGCVADVELVGMTEAVRNASRATCFPKCRFSKAKPPEVPDLCWNHSTLDWAALVAADNATS